MREKYLSLPNSLYLGLPAVRAPPGVDGRHEHAMACHFLLPTVLSLLWVLAKVCLVTG